jgi:hypothetical protein
MKVTVTQGDVTVSSVDLLYDTPDIKILEIHTDQKHPVVAGYTSGFMQEIWPADWEAREDAENLTATRVTFNFDRGTPEMYWGQVASADRYRLTVMLFRYHLDHDHRTEIFRNEAGESK